MTTHHRDDCQARPMGLPGCDCDIPGWDKAADPARNAKANDRIYRALERAGVPRQYQRWAARLGWNLTVFDDKERGPFDRAPGEVDER